MVRKMLRKIRIVLITIIMKIASPKKIRLKGFQDIRFDTEFAIQNKGSVVLGRRTTVFKRVTFAANGGIISIGDNCFFNRNCIVAALDHITIGNKCIFGPNVTIYDHDHIFDHDRIIRDEYKTSPIIIEDGCWIGANVTILRGTHIGAGCVIGAGTVVKGKILPHSLVTSSRELIVRRIER